MRALQDFLRKSGISRDQFYRWRKLGLIPNSVIQSLPLERGGRKIALKGEAWYYVQVTRDARKRFGQKRGLERARLFSEFNRGIDELRAFVGPVLDLLRDKRYGQFFHSHGVLTKSIAHALVRGYDVVERIIEKAHPNIGSQDYWFVKKFFCFKTPGQHFANILKLFEKKPDFIFDPNFELSQARRLYLDFRKKLPDLRLFVASVVLAMCQTELDLLISRGREDPELGRRLVLNLPGFTKIISKLGFQENEGERELCFFSERPELGEYIQDKLLPLLQEKK